MAYKEFANIYDELIYEDINYDKVADKIINICRENNLKFEDYLDLACGTGNVSINVAKYFKTVYAVDLSDDMLNVAFDKFKKNKIKAKVICQDMCELSLNKRFDLITSVLDSTNYITEDEDLLDYFSSVYEHLKENGIFIFDINSYYKLSTVLGNNIYTYSSEEIFYTWENSFEDDVLNMFLTFFVKTENELYKKFEEEHFERAYKESYIEDILKKCNFRIINKFSGYSDEEVNENSERILYIVSK
ncbi:MULTISPECIES: class I SAM-dependent DNA methyltransferase [Clostridium]|jgi:Predicted methyltransferase (contains TPR repeat)|uniref:SAM-dependent methyltransferase n=2 Tax=Clostridium beijerinckii TaxID=1520 RepID=A0A0B5QC68_CLOBE|nr:MULTISPECIES: class I SAM-dependent methyltransferase [Clostridium]ABR33970.1 Methyltransferase type 11 [Clostridium beijerinckii NCIMB 8052]AIU02806.1 methyltransferase type 11 [Clostridium beijerinckii ATCC 35702]AJG98540.1 SAM-dependent methyltransferase [Clostridium beijerinckii]ALB47007.1 class I SAM-dependent methyltransferase [Clostridium beijerinckii NRRL B-598]AQS04419.1 dTDP-3-amino-3,6-dideoxy-alpha-D-glucopyranose N,N-dimethyltransferase [Clostridium beijerinckii]